MVGSNQLVVVGGPSAVGKTWLMEGMQRGLFPDLFSRIELNEHELIHYIDAEGLKDFSYTFFDQLVLHYDFIHQNHVDVGNSLLLDLINGATDVCVLTLCAPSVILSKRISSRLQRVKKSNPKNTLRLERLLEKEKLYDNRQQLLNKYGEWVEVIERYGIEKHMIVNSYSMSQSDWLIDSSEVKRALISALAGES